MMRFPGFTAEASLHGTIGHYGSLSQRLSVLPASRLPSVQIAKLPGGAAPGVHGTKCGPCGSYGWRNCVETLDATPIGETYKSACVGSCGSWGPPTAVLGGWLICRRCWFGGTLNASASLSCFFVPGKY